jgi:hypothetical protein
MSLNVRKIEVAKVMDPRLEINTKKDYVALKGALVNSWQPFRSVNTNNNSAQVTCNPPSRNIAVSRLVFKKVSFDITVTGTNTTGGGTLLNEGYHAPRAYPLTSVTASESITINNDSVTQAPINQMWRALMRYRNEHKDRFGCLSLTPSMLDQFQDYEDGVNTVRNPLAPYGDNSYENTRGGFVDYVVQPQAPDNTEATITLTVYEPILLSPFNFGCKANFYSALAGVQNMSYTATFSNLSRVLSLVQGQGAPAGQIVLNTPQVNISSFELFFNYLTPDPVNPIPRNMELSYFDVVSYPTRYNTPILPNGTVSLSMQSIQVTSIPKRIYVFAKESDNVETSFTSDSYLSLNPDVNPLTLTWNNNQFLSQANIADLYNIAVKNGCNMSYSQFTKFTGSVLALDFGTDIGLYSNQAAGTIGNYQLSLTAQFKNTSNRTINDYSLYVVVVYEGVFNVNDGNCSHMIGVLSPDDVLNAEALPMGSYKESQDVYGGSFFGSLKNLFTKGHHYLKKHKLISRGLGAIDNPYAQAGSKVAEIFGYGTSGGSLANLCEDEDEYEY